MEATFLILFFLSVLISHSLASPTHTIGVHPLDDKYYSGEVIKCKDGSKSFTRDRLNDNFCDCPDGTDEPGTSACPAGKFYCKNVGSTPRFLFSSRVNDHICDCCDGSDEYDGSIICPNQCIMGGFVYQKVKYHSTESLRDSVGARKSESGSHDSMQKFEGLKVLVFLQVVVVILFLAFRLCHKRKTRRRNSR